MPSAPIAGHNTQIYITSGTSISMTNEAMTAGSDSQTWTDGTAAHQCWDSTATFVTQAQYDEVQTVTITGAPTGGTFTLTFGGNTTTALAFNAAASAVQTALQALASIGASNMLVTGVNGGPYTCEFTAGKGLAAQVLMTASGAGLTGGTSPGVTVTRWQGGAVWATITTGFTLQYPVGRVYFTVLQSPGTQVRISSGKYFAFSFLGYANLVSPTLTAATYDVTSFTNPVTSWKTFIVGLLGATIKLTKFWLDGTFLAHLTTADLLVLQIYPGQNVNQRFQGYGILTSDAIKSAQNAANMEDLNFVVNGQLYFIPS